MLALKHADLRQAQLVVQQLELHAATSGQACDANLVSKARQVYESSKVNNGNLLREIDFPQALRPPMNISEASSSTREAEARSVQRAAAELLNEEEMSSSSPSNVRSATRCRYKK